MSVLSEIFTYPARLLWRLLLVLAVLALLAGMTGWAMLAIYFGDSQTSLLQTLLAAGFGLVGLATLAGIWFARTRMRVVAAFAVSFSLVLAWWLSIEPSNERDWAPETARLPYANIDGDRVSVYNIRNFRYRTETDFSTDYYDRTFDLERLDSVDFFAVYWMGPSIAHTIVSFGFGGEDYLAISIEARKEAGEGYSTIKGFFRQYEQIHIVADERDVIRLRTNIRNNPPEEVYRYSLRGSRETARHFFLAYIDAINREYEQPEFYNTLFSNCTNVIWMHARVNPERVPFSWKILASGYAPEYLYEMGRLDTSVPFDELTLRGHVNPLARQLGDADDFSRRIREPRPAAGEGGAN